MTAPPLTIETGVPIPAKRAIRLDESNKAVMERIRATLPLMAKGDSFHLPEISESMYHNIYNTAKRMGIKVFVSFSRKRAWRVE